MHVTIKGSMKLSRTSLEKLANNMNPALALACNRAGMDMVNLLAERAPRSGTTSNAVPIAGDEPGSLSNSFQLHPATSLVLRARVLTIQPNKLNFVTGGTGVYGPRHMRITPRFKQALMWEGAANPYRSVKGMPPNPFVDTVRAEFVGVVERNFKECMAMFGARSDAYLALGQKSRLIFSGAAHRGGGR